MPNLSMPDPQGADDVTPALLCQTFRCRFRRFYAKSYDAGFHEAVSEGDAERVDGDGKTCYERCLVLLGQFLTCPDDR